jgi:hypothetical protein
LDVVDYLVSIHLDALLAVVWPQLVLSQGPPEEVEDPIMIQKKKMKMRRKRKKSAS